ncbi:MAG: SHOCT domain-containing protein [Acholeplasmataceae bacterium]
MGRVHKGLDLAGIILVYVIGGFWALLFMFAGIQWMAEGDTEGIFFIFLTLFLIFIIIMTSLYHVNKITNYVLIGILGIFGSVLGGIFILVGQPKSGGSQSSANDRNDLSNLEYRLRQLETLLVKGVITKDEYDRKRQSIINN